MRRLLGLAALLLAAGCQPAARYDKLKPAAAAPPPAVTKNTEPDLTWAPPNRDLMLPEVPIVFVHEIDGDKWGKLPGFWNRPPTEADKAAALIGLGAGPGLPVPEVPARKEVRVKTPTGLDEPRYFLPAANPPTLGQWELGRRLFFDKGWLTESRDLSCADCHVPDRGFTDGGRGTKSGDDYVNTPTLVNCLYNARQFWDGRAAALEEVVQRTPADEGAAPDRKTFRHAWGGVVHRLRSDEAGYPKDFEHVFGAPATQDSVGRALATYLRTLLAGDSLHDRALREQAKAKSPTLETVHYLNYLDDAALKELDRAGKPKADVAAEVLRGYRLFNNLDDKRKANCVACHGTREYTDGGFHDLGVGWVVYNQVGTETGRFLSAPIGEKNAALIGAYKTPTLRGLLRKSHYFHDGSAISLREAVEFHVKGGTRENNAFIDPEIHDPMKLPLASRLEPEDVDALVLFLRALNGEPVDEFVRRPPPK